MKILTLILLAWLLVSCKASNYSAALNHNGKAIKIAISESLSGKHLDVSLNNESVGQMNREDYTYKKINYSKLNTKFGVLKIVRINEPMVASGDNMTWDCYLDDSYVGTVKAGKGIVGR